MRKLVIFFVGLFAISCAGWQLDPVVNPTQIRTCAAIADLCSRAIEENKDDPEEAIRVTAQCVLNWEDAGCTELVKALAGQKKENTPRDEKGGDDDKEN